MEGVGRHGGGTALTPDIKPPPQGPKQPFRVMATCTLLAYSQPDAAEQARLALHKIGGKDIGSSAAKVRERGGNG